MEECKRCRGSMGERALKATRRVKEVFIGFIHELGFEG